MTKISEETKKSLSYEDQQQALLFQFVSLYERWSEDRQVAAKQGYDLAKRLEQFENEVSRFSNIEEALIVAARFHNHTGSHLSQKMGSH